MAEPLPSWDSHKVESLRRFAQISLIIADIDGTLLDKSHRHLSRFAEILRRNLLLHRYQVKLSIATGRALGGVRSVLEKLLVPRAVPLILYNGSVVVKNGSFSVIYRERIPASAVRQILEICSTLPVRVYSYVYDDLGDQVLRIADHECVVGWSRVGRPRFEFNGLPVSWQRRFTVDEEFSPSAVVIEAPAKHGILPLVERSLASIPAISSTRSSERFVEVRPRGSNKGIAAAIVAESLNLSRENVLAIGDNDNDCEMLAWAGTGVAIAGASQAAQASSDFVTKHGVVGGVVEVLRLVKHAKRYFFRPERTRASQP